MKKLLEYIIFNSYYIALCAAALTLMNLVILNLSILDNIHIVIFNACATLLAYRYHYKLKPKEELAPVRAYWIFQNAPLKLVSNIIFVILGSICLLKYNTNQLLDILLIGFLTIIYSYPLLGFFRLHKKRIKDFGKVKPIYLAIVWLLTTCIIPLLTITDFAIWPLHLLISNYLFMLSLCIYFDQKDISRDAAKEILTYANTFKPRTFLLLNNVLIVMNIGFQIIYIKSYSISLLITLCVLLYLINTYFKKASIKEYDYLIYIDGLMLLWPILFFITNYSTIWQLTCF